jgi:hypothetical protein
VDRARAILHTLEGQWAEDIAHRGETYGTTERTCPLILVLDNGPIHTSKATTKALAERPWLTVEWLPNTFPNSTISNAAGAI